MIAAILTVVLAAGAASPEDVLAHVDATAITRGEVTARLRLLRERGSAATTIQALDGLVDEALLAAAARGERLDGDPAVRGEIESHRRRLLAEALVADVAEKTTVSEEGLRDLYHTTGDTIRLVVLKLATREQADAALARVKGGADLAAEARSALDPALASTGGDTGTLTRAQLEPALADAVFRAPVGGLFGPVEIRLGWAVGRVVERTIADEAGFAQRRETVAAFARKQIAAQTRRHLAAQLKAKAAVAIDEAFLKGLGKGADATPAQLDHVIATVNGKPLRYRDIQSAIAQVSGSGGHLAGAAVKISFAQAGVEEALLAGVAQQRGLEPAVAAAFPAVERRVLAEAIAARVARTPGAGAPDAKVRARIHDLRARAKVQLDEAKLASVDASPGH